MSRVKLILWIWVITLGLMTAVAPSPCFALGDQNTGYRISSTAQDIDVWSNCKNVRSSSSLNLFAPTKTAVEWTNFRTWSANNPARVTLAACAAAPTCSDGIQNQGEEDVDCGGPCAACDDGCAGQPNGTPCGTYSCAFLPSTCGCVSNGFKQERGTDYSASCQDGTCTGLPTSRGCTGLCGPFIAYSENCGSECVSDSNCSPGETCSEWMCICTRCNCFSCPGGQTCVNTPGFGPQCINN